MVTGFHENKYIFKRNLSSKNQSISFTHSLRRGLYGLAIRIMNNEKPIDRALVENFCCKNMNNGKPFAKCYIYLWVDMTVTIIWLITDSIEPDRCMEVYTYWNMFVFHRCASTSKTANFGSGRQIKNLSPIRDGARQSKRKGPLLVWVVQFFLYCSHRVIKMKSICF